MIDKLLRRLDVDVVQWRALTRVSLKHDLRRAQSVQKTGKRTKPGSQIAFQLFFYFVYGGLFGVVVAGMADTFLGTGIIVTYTMFTIGVMVLLDYSTLVTSPDDYAVLGYQPISSRTYFAARVTNLLTYVLAVTVSLSLVPAVALSMRLGFDFTVGAALILATSLAAVTTALAMVLLYGLLLRHVPAQRLKNALSYLQLATSFLIYGGYVLVPRLLEDSPIMQRQLEKTPAVLLFPASWFTSWVEIARGVLGWKELLPTAISVIALVVVARAAAGRLSLEFSERLGALTTVSGGTKEAPRARSWSPFRGGEARAVWLLIRGQFRSDQKFRMSVLGILPMTAIYLIMTIADGSVSDPFVRGLRGSNATVLNMAVIMFPVLLNFALTRSENFMAAWIFYATPADRQATVNAMKRTILFYFVVPYLALFGLLLSIWVHNVLHIAVHILVLALISNLTLTIMTVTSPELPFSRPPQKGERTVNMLLVTLIAVVLAAAAIPIASAFFYISSARTAGLIVGLWLSSVVIERIGRVRMRRRVLESEFAG